MKKLNITFCSFPDFSSNAKPLYLYMKKRYKDSMNFTWIVRTDEMYNNLKKMGITVFKLGTAEYFDYVKTTDVFFSTHADITGEKEKGMLYVELWHGIGAKQTGFLSDEVTSYDKEWYSSLKRKIDYFIVPTNFWRTVFSVIFNVRYNRVLSLGYPKLDSLLNKNSKNNLQKLVGIDIFQFDKIIFYLPTFRKGCEREMESLVNKNNLFNIEEYDEEDLISYLKEKNYLLCIKKHPSEELELKNIDCENIWILKEEDLNQNHIAITEILDASNLLITDYSSVGVEYTFLNKPIIYLVHDIDSYSDNRGIIFDNYSFWMPGLKVKDYNQLINSINESFTSDLVNTVEYQEKRSLWFGNLTDGGCKNICDFLFDKSELSKRVVLYEDYEESLENDLKDLEKTCNEKVRNLESENESLKEELNIIVNSKGWKILEKMRKIIRRRKK